MVSKQQLHSINVLAHLEQLLFHDATPPHASKSINTNGHQLDRVMYALLKGDMVEEEKCSAMHIPGTTNKVSSVHYVYEAESNQAGVNLLSPFPINKAF